MSHELLETTHSPQSVVVWAWRGGRQTRVMYVTLLDYVDGEVATIMIKSTQLKIIMRKAYFGEGFLKSTEIH